MRRRIPLPVHLFVGFLFEKKIHSQDFSHDQSIVVVILDAIE